MGAKRLRFSALLIIVDLQRQSAVWTNRGTTLQLGCLRGGPVASSCVCVRACVRACVRSLVGVWLDVCVVVVWESIVCRRREAEAGRWVEVVVVGGSQC